MPQNIPENFEQFLKRFSPKALKWGLLVVMGLVWSAYALLKGPLLSPDSRTYGEWADILLQHNFNYSAWQEELRGWSLVTAPKIFYAGWITLVALLKLIFGDFWIYGVVILNLGGGLLMAWVLLVSLWKISEDRLTLVFGGLFLTVCIEYLLWVPYVLTEALFAALVLALFVQVAGKNEKKSFFSSKKLVGVFLIFIAILFFRPTSVPVFVFILFAFGFAVWTLENWNSPPERTRQLKIFVACLLIISFGLIVLAAAIQQDPSLWPFGFAGDWVLKMSREAREGIVIGRVYETYHSPPESMLDFIVLNLDKLATFFSFFQRSYSPAHLIYNAALCLGFLFALLEIFRTRSCMSGKTWYACSMAVLLLGTIGLFQSVNQLDGDHRYRLPGLMPMVFMSSLGWGILWRRWAGIKEPMNRKKGN